MYQPASKQVKTSLKISQVPVGKSDTRFSLSVSTTSTAGAAVITGFLLFSACSIVIPPVTLTGQKTAAERQIVGEEKYIEKDAWLISSARTVENQKKQQEKGKKKTEKEKKLSVEMFTALRTFEFFEDRLLDYRNKSIVGESTDGKVINLTSEEVKKTLPPAYFDDRTKEMTEKFNTKKAQARINNLVEKINTARDNLRMSGLAELEDIKDKKKLEIEKAQLEKSLNKQFRSELGKGHWYQREDGSWDQVTGDEQFDID